MWAVGTALDIYRDDKAWDRLVRNGMAQDFSWSRQVPQYVDMYERLIRS
jgi:starch synthase